MRSSERHSLATTMTTRPKYSSRLFIYIHISSVYIHQSCSFFFPVSSLLVSLSLTFLFNQYVYIENEKHRHKFILVREGDNIVFCIIILYKSLPLQCLLIPCKFKVYFSVFKEQQQY